MKDTPPYQICLNSFKDLTSLPCFFFPPSPFALVTYLIHSRLTWYNVTTWLHFILLLNPPPVSIWQKQQVNDTNMMQYVRRLFLRMRQQPINTRTSTNNERGTSKNTTLLSLYQSFNDCNRLQTDVQSIHHLSSKYNFKTPHQLRLCKSSTMTYHWLILI